MAYMGNDEANEFIYKFISSVKYDKNNPDLDILDKGTLHVARFDSVPNKHKSLGKWLELTHGKNGLTKENGFESQADILINTRLTASFVGATPMDRVKWIASDNEKKYVYITLTNNTKRKEVDGGNPRANDGKTMLVGIQHPGERNNKSSFPYLGNKTPKKPNKQNLIK